MFVHEPEEPGVKVSALVLWDDPGLAQQAVSICRDIESRVRDVKFRIEAADAGELTQRAEEIRAKACEADVVLVALLEGNRELPEMLQDWFQEWAAVRERQAGALAVLRPSGPVNGEEFRQMLQEEGGRDEAGASRREALEFWEECAKRARMEFFWGGLESELEDATRGLRILEAGGGGSFGGVGRSLS